MNEVKIEIKNGYGIELLRHTFDFDGSEEHPQQDTNIVYAQNGTMKSSLAKTLHDYSQENPIKDYIFDITGTCSLVNQSGTRVPPYRVFSVASFDNGRFESGKTANLLVNAELREKYVVLMDKFQASFTTLMERIKSVSGIGAKTSHQEIIDIICSQYGETIPKTPQGLINVIKSSRTEIENRPDFIQDIPYSVIGSKDAQKFADDNKGIIQELMDVYDQVKKTAIFVRGDFDSGNARKLIDIVDKTKFLAVDHEIELLNSETGELEKVASLEQLQEKLSTDIDRILDKNPALKKKFIKMIADLSTATRYSLKRILEDDKTKDVILLMNNSNLFRRSLWEGYLKGCLNEADEVASIQDEIRQPIEDIIKDAEGESTQWDLVVKKFNHRFRNLPYEIEITNKASVILDGIVEPQAALRYKHPRRSSKLFADDREKLFVIGHLSTGERKALYLLNVMFEVEIAQKSGNDHLVVLDDIVDSFDYKNKYAFLEYIYEISKQYNHVKLLVLTHNYDFFRLLQSRLFGDNYRKHSWFAIKESAETKIIKAEHFRVFKNMRENSETNKKMWLSMIPFARNLAEYKCNDLALSESYQLLTQCLHSLDTNPTVADVKVMLKREIDIDNTPFNDSDKIEELLIDEADIIVASASGGINLHDNLILAMACRWAAENYMKSKLSSTEIATAKSSGSVFTRELYSAVTAKGGEDDDTLSLLDQVNLITPEHIHVNSFMYEPLLDIGFDELKGLYGELSTL